jgi:hypothetical protein
VPRSDNEIESDNESDNEIESESDNEIDNESDNEIESESDNEIESDSDSESESDHLGARQHVNERRPARSSHHRSLRLRARPSCRAPA